MKKRLLYLTSLILIFMSGLAYAQDRTISGTVTNEAGEALVGATVQIKGTATGVATDIDGKYKISVPSNATHLIFAFVGMEAQEVEIGVQSVIDVALVDGSLLTEVVVVGYGEQKREALTGSVVTADSKLVEQIPASSFEKMLQGAAPGVQITSQSGQPGASTQVRIRGISSISAGNEPLYVVDGIPIITGDNTQLTTTHNALSSLNPNDIASITVLKDAAAASLYGSRASNGVILITTKKGNKGKTQFDVRTQVGVSSRAFTEYDNLNSTQYIDLMEEGVRNIGFDQDFASAFVASNYGTNEIDTDWFDVVTRDAITQSYQLSASGGSENTTFYASGGYYNEEGVVIGSELERISGRLNLTQRASDRINFGINVTASQSFQRSPQNGTFFSNPMFAAFVIPPTVRPRNDDGSINQNLNSGWFNNNSPLQHAEEFDNDTKTFRLVANAFAEIDIYKGIKFKTSWGADFLDIIEQQYWPSNSNDGATFNGLLQRNGYKEFVWVTTNTLTWSETFNDVHDVDFLLGFEAQEADEDQVFLSGNGFASPQLRTLASASTPRTVFSSGEGWSLASYFGRVNYSYDQKYYLSASYRRDGSSRFGANNRWGDFYSVGGSWRISEESFFEGLSDYVNNAKLRASYGTSGNFNIENFASRGLYNFDAPYQLQAGSRPDGIENPNLTWEKAQNFNVGLDFRLFDRVSATIDYYNRRTTALLLDVPVSSITGFTTATRNVGKMENKGWEFSFNSDNLDISGFRWNTNFNIAFNRNKILTLNNGEEIIDGTKVRREGEDFQSYRLRVWRGVDPDTGLPLWETADGNTTSNVAQAERMLVGSASPDFLGGITNVFSYKGVELSVFFQYAFGHQVYDGGGFIYESDGTFTGVGANQATKALERWQQPGDITEVPAFVFGNSSNSNSSSTRYLKDGDYVRLKNLTLSYHLPKSILDKVKMRSVRAYVLGQNLWTWTKEKEPMLDPETQINGVLNLNIPLVRTISFGLDFGF